MLWRATVLSDEQLRTAVPGICTVASEGHQVCMMYLGEEHGVASIYITLYIAVAIAHTGSDCVAYKTFSDL